MAVLIETSVGDIVVDLYVKERPKCSINFLKLCKLKYYNFILFHSVQQNFIAQTGDPTGTGEGGESMWGILKGEDYRYFEAENLPRLKHVKTGTLSMVNNGNGAYGSQFFLTLSEHLDNLDAAHAVFGEVAEGLDVLVKISEAYCDKDGRPYQDIRIYHTVILEDPFNDPEGLKPPERSPSPPKQITDSNRIGAEEDIDDYKGLSEAQIQELIAKRESRANTQILEMIGDIPDADAKPPENVLFVCKLNPATTDEDLEIIFSRFGTILSCEVIRDQKTGESLQYAFIEFENEDDCVKAYFKMDNVLIDDRRIHVDFSQSLAKVKGLHKRKYSELEEQRQPEGTNRRDDGYVAKKKAQKDGYEMVFDDDDATGDFPRSSKGKRRDERGFDDDSKKSRKSKYQDKDGKRGDDTYRTEGRRKDDRDSHRERDRSGRNRGREERRHKEQGHKHHSRSRSRSRSRERQRMSHDSRHHMHRSRSRDRQRR